MEISFSPSEPIIPIKSEKPKEMLSVSSEGNLTKVKINFSSLSLMQECWRKTEYSLIRGLRAEFESPATLFGSAIHKALEVFYLSPRTERKLPPHFKESVVMIAEGNWNEEYEENLLLRALRAFVLKAKPLSALSPENKRSIQTGCWILSHYFQVYLTDTYIVMTDEKGPLVERTFQMPLYADYELEITGFGTIDVVLQNEITGEVLPADHKTTSQLGPQFYSRLKPNHQYTLYTWATNEILKLETRSFMINALQVKAMPKTLRGSVPDFARQITTRTEEDFEDLRKTIVTYVRAFLERREEGYFPMTSPGPCSSYNGCPYLDVCSAPNLLKENIISAKFKETLKGGTNG